MSVLEWAKRPIYHHGFAHTVEAVVEGDFHLRERVEAFLNENFGPENGRWAALIEGREYDENRYRLRRRVVIVGFKSETDLIFFLTGVDRG